MIEYYLFVFLNFATTQHLLENKNLLYDLHNFVFNWASTIICSSQFTSIY